jgi:hypothetical protein
MSSDEQMPEKDLENLLTQVFFALLLFSFFFSFLFFFFPPFSLVVSTEIRTAFVWSTRLAMAFRLIALRSSG